MYVLIILLISYNLLDQARVWRCRPQLSTLSFCQPVVVMTHARITYVTITHDTLATDSEDGRSIAVPIGWYPRLSYATPAEREHFEISGAGYGIHWPDLDEDIGVEGMLLGKKSAESAESLARWLEARRSS